MKNSLHSQFQPPPPSTFGLLLFVFAALIGTVALLGTANWLGHALGWTAHAQHEVKNFSSQHGSIGELTAFAVAGMFAAILAIIGCFLRPPAT